jgi:hypothetical protein
MASITKGTDGRSAAAWTPRRLSDELREVLEALARVYTQILASLDEHARAIGQADARTIGRCSADQERLLEEVAVLEQRRREIVARATSLYPELHEAAKSSELTVTVVTRALPESERPILSDLSEGLRTRVLKVKERSETVRLASIAMVSHVEGLMRHIGRRLSHSGTYGRRGVVESGCAVVSALDLKS